MSMFHFLAHGRKGASPHALLPGVLAALFVLTAAAPEAHAQSSTPDTADAPRLVTPDDYGDFESLGATTLSDDGRWLAVSVSPTDGDGALHLYLLDAGADSVIVIENGMGIDFSPDGRWAALSVRPGEAERNRLQRERTPVRNALVMIDLHSGELQRTSDIQSWSFSPDAGFLALRRYRAGEGNARGADIVIRDIARGTDLNLGNVAEFSWHEDAPLLAMIVDAEGMAGNGVRLYDAPTGTLRPLHSEQARFGSLTWRDDSSDLAVFRIDPDEERGDTLRTVLAWKNVSGSDPALHTLPGNVSDREGGELRVTDFQGLRWSDDGRRIFVAGVPRDPPPPEDEEGEGRTSSQRSANGDSVPGLEIWHARDIDPVPQQRLRANQARRASDLVAWELEADRTVILGGRQEGHSLSLLANQASAVLLDDSPWAVERMFGPVYRDLYHVDVATGQRERVLERIQFYSGASPDGRYLLYFDADDWHALDLRSGEVANLTAGLEGVFVNEQNDHTVEQRPAYGSGGWLQDESAVFLYDRYDVWRVNPDGSGGERITRGAEDEVRHRLVRLNFEDGGYEPGEPLYVALYGEWTKDSGYGRIRANGSVEALVYGDRSISRIAKADDAERYIFVAQRYDMPPNVHVADASFASPRQVTSVNAHVDGFLWGRSELIDYENTWGERLQGALFYPANYEPGRQYPMIVYPYERRSQVLHSWSNPSETNAYNTTVFTQNGYFVLQPDVVYRARNPGLSFMEAIDPALDAVLATGMIDPDRIGLTGHSWGGYQTTFAMTQTDRFAAGVAGAPLTNLVSMYLSFYWNSGGTDARIFEISQGRMEVPWWEDYESYVANSPVHHIQNMNTPLLMAFGTEDGAVEFNQGVEFYNAARRANKDFVLLVYEGENHSLRQRPNQLDYHRRTLEWFDHYLKGHEAPAWITDGVPWLVQEEKLRQGPAAGRRPGSTVANGDDGANGGR
jgi:dipeptidyl aminopeptidase/acylaminoacyl peptidase